MKLNENLFLEWIDDGFDWEYVDSKEVKDSDGFMTEYTWYKRLLPSSEERHIFIFGDSDIYGPEDSYADAEFDSYDLAKEWFDNYKGFAEDDLDESLKEAKSVTKKDLIDWLHKHEKLALTEKEFDYLVQNLWEAIKREEAMSGEAYRSIEEVDVGELIDGSDNPAHSLGYKLMGLIDEEDLEESIKPNLDSEELQTLAKKHNIKILDAMENGDLRMEGAGADLMKFYQEAEKLGLWEVDPSLYENINEFFGKKNGVIDWKGKYREANSFLRDYAEQIYEILDRKYNVYPFPSPHSSRGYITVSSPKDFTKKINKELKHDHDGFEPVDIYMVDSNSKQVTYSYDEPKFKPMSDQDKRDKKFLDSMSDKYLLASYDRSNSCEKVLANIEESLNYKDFMEFKSIADEVGLKTAGDLERFRKEEMQPGESELEAIKRYRQELIDAGVDLSKLVNESLQEGAVKDVAIDIEAKEKELKDLESSLHQLKSYNKKDCGAGGQFDSVKELEDEIASVESDIDTVKKEIDQLKAKVGA